MNRIWHYFILLKFIAPLFIGSSDCSNESEEIIRRISVTFLGGLSNTCYIFDGFYLHEGLLNIESNHYVFKMEEIIFSGELPFCPSIVISATSSNDTTIYHFIEKYINMTQSKVLVIKETSFMMELMDLFSITWERNLNIAILEGIPNPDNMMGDNILRKHEKYVKNVTIYSVMWEYELLSCSLDDFQCFSNIPFVNSTWKPELMFEKLKRRFKVSASYQPPYFERHGSTFKGIDYELVNLMVPNWPTTFRIFPEHHESDRGVNYETLVEFLNSANDGDMSVGGLWLTNDFPSTHPYAKQCNTFLVHRPSLLPDSTFVFQYFQLPLWISYFGVLIFMSFVLKFSYTLYNINYSFDYCLLIILHYVANLGIAKFPERNQFYTRYLLTVWIVFCLLMTTYFCVGLTVTLRFPRFTQAINHWHDMVDLRIKWVENSKFYKDRLTNWGNHDEYLRDLGNLFRYEEGIDVMNKKLAKNYAVRVQKLPGFYLTNTGWMDEYAKKNFKLLKDCFLVWYNSFLLKNPTPFLEYFNRKTLEVVEYGFVKYWYQYHTNSKKNRYMMMFFNEYTDEVIQFIKLDKLKSCFLLLFCGLFLSSIAFLLEKLHFSSRNRRVYQDRSNSSLD